MATSIHLPKTLYHGPGSLAALESAVKRLGIDHLFVILSERAKSELEGEIRSLLKKSRTAVTFCTHASKEPTLAHVAEVRKRFQSSGCDGILAIGGGSAIDLAKAVAVTAKTNIASIKNFEIGHIERHPLIAVPTTAGSGSEATKVFVITDEKENVKHNPAHPSIIPDVAILDPELTLNLPRNVTAQTGMDALAHAIEAFVSNKASPASDMYAMKAIELIGTNLTTVYHEPNNLLAREQMLLGSHFAGIAFSNASTNLAHAAARPLGARFQLPHGLTVALTLPPVVRFGLEAAKDRYEKIAAILHTDDLIMYLENLNETFEIYEEARRFIDKTVLENMIPLLVQDALSGNGILTNRKIPDKEDVFHVYEQIRKRL